MSLLLEAQRTRTPPNYGRLERTLDRVWLPAGNPQGERSGLLDGQDWGRRYKWPVHLEKGSLWLREVQEAFWTLPHERHSFSVLPPIESEVSQPSASLSISSHRPSFRCFIPGPEQELPEPVLSLRIGENLKLSSEFWLLCRFEYFIFWIEAVFRIKIDLKFY